MLRLNSINYFVEKINWKEDEYEFFFFYLKFCFRVNQVRKIFIRDISYKIFRMRLWIESNSELRENNQEV